MISSRAFVLLLVATASCASEQTPASPPVAPATPSAAVSAAAAPSAAPAAPAEAQPVSVKVVGVGASPESAMYRRVQISFANPGGRACTFTSYTVRWGAASKTFSNATFKIAPGESRDRMAKVNPDDDGYAALEGIDLAKITVEAKGDCPIVLVPPK